MYAKIVDKKCQMKIRRQNIYDDNTLTTIYDEKSSTNDYDKNIVDGKNLEKLFQRCVLDENIRRPNTSNENIVDQYS